MRIGIVGAGWTGLWLAHKLARPSVQVTLIDQSSQLGGLSSYYHYGPFTWDKYYHVILPSDAELIGALEALGLSDQLQWRETKTGYYVDGKIHPLSTTKDFLLFPPLNIMEKCRLAWTIVRGAAIQDWPPLEKITVADWLVKYSGKNTFEKFWKPLLLAKLGSHYEQTSAVFIWSYIKRLFSARDGSSAKKEQLGYVQGGYHTILTTIHQRLQRSNVKVLLDEPVMQISSTPLDQQIKMTTQRRDLHFDKVIFTGPTSILSQITDHSLVSVHEKAHGVQYLGVICLVLIHKTPLSAYYVLNIAEPEVPFTGMIGMSSLVDRRETAGYYITYLPKYVHADDELLNAPDAAIKESFLKGVQKMFPSFASDQIVSAHVHRAKKVQPLQTLNYSQRVPEVITNNANFYVVNTSQFVNDTLNNNSVTKHVEQFLRSHQKDLLTQNVYEQGEAVS